jgi:hypothetical protein
MGNKLSSPFANAQYLVLLRKTSIGSTSPLNGADQKDPDASSRLGVYFCGTARQPAASLTTCLPLLSPFGHKRSSAMSEDAFNMSMRKFLKEVGITSQRKIEETVRDAQIGGKKLKVRMTLTAEGTGLNHVVDGEIELP